jgi:molybdopterin synthase catalytic subunit
LQFEFTRDRIDPRLLEQSVRSDQDGAVVTFLGTTRDHHDGKAVLRLGYEAYEEMATVVVLRILGEVADLHDIGRARAVHRLGEVPVGDASIAVVVAAAHRGPAFEACRAIMDRIKHQAPIFKREVTADGSHWVGELPRPSS